MQGEVKEGDEKDIGKAVACESGIFSTAGPGFPPRFGRRKAKKTLRYRFIKWLIKVFLPGYFLAMRK